MPGFTSRDDIINELTTGGKSDVYTFYKIAPSVTEAAGVWHSLWRGVGQPGAGANPAATPGVAYTSDAGSTTSGSIWFPDRSTDQKFMLSFGATSTAAGTLMLYDRLAGVGGVVLNTTGSKTINSAALDRYSGTAAQTNEAWVEFSTASTATSGVFNLNSYTSADGTTAQVGGSVTMPAAAMNIDSMVQLPLTAAKAGIRSIEAGLNVGTATTTGVGNVIIIRPLARLQMVANQWNEVSFLDDIGGLPRIFDNATLGLAFCGTAAVTPTVWGTVSCAYG